MLPHCIGISRCSCSSSSSNSNSSRGNMTTATDLDCLCVVAAHTHSGLWLRGSCSRSVCCMQLIAKDFMVAIYAAAVAVADDGDNAKIYTTQQQQQEPIAAGKGQLMQRIQVQASTGWRLAV